MRPPRLPLLPFLLLLLAAASLISTCNCQKVNFRDFCPPDTVQASSNVTDLTELTFWGRVGDGRVWFVEFYADWCSGCKRIASHVSMLADALAERHPHIMVARLNCGGSAEHFCDHVIKISRTPSFTVYYEGKKAIDYKADFFFYDMMWDFIVEVAANLKGFSLPSSSPPATQQGKEDEDDDDYE